jgi:hypothetical protein
MPADWDNPGGLEVELHLLAGIFRSPIPIVSLIGYHVYFIQVGIDGPIKIGKTKGTVQERLSALQTASPYELRIVGIVERARDSLERELHERFSHLRMRGEWFRPGLELITYIRDHAIRFEPPAPEPVDTPERIEQRRRDRLREVQAIMRLHHPFSREYRVLRQEVDELLSKHVLFFAGD